MEQGFLPTKPESANELTEAQTRFQEKVAAINQLLGREVASLSTTTVSEGESGTSSVDIVIPDEVMSEYGVMSADELLKKLQQATTE